MIISKKQTNALISGLLIGLVLLFIWTKFLDYNEVKNYLINIKIHYASLAVIFYFFSMFLRSLRMKKLLEPTTKLKLSEAFNIFLASNMVNILLPIRAGEFYKCYLIKKIKKIRISRTLPVIVVDKIMDITPIILVIAILPFISLDIPKSVEFLILLILALLASLILMIFISLIYKDFFINNLLKALFFLPNKFKSRIKETAHLFVEGIASIKNHPQRLITVFFITICAVISDSIYLILVFAGFGYKIGLLVSIFSYTLFSLSFILPTPPAQLGSNEIILQIIFVALFGMKNMLVGAVIIFMHFFIGSLSLIVGIGSMLIIKKEIGNLSKSKI